MRNLEKDKLNIILRHILFFISILYTVFLLGLNYLRIYDISIWGDEGIGIYGASMSFNDMIKWIAQNGHAPLHYVFTWLMCNIFGFSGVVYHLVPIIPVTFCFILVWYVTFYKKWFSWITYIIFVTFATMLYSSLTYNLEIRMYSLCQMFVLASFITLYAVLKTNQNKYYVLMTIMGIGAVYSHYFALAPIGLMYVVLSIYIFLYFRNHILKVVMSGGAVLISFLPWYVYCKMIVGRDVMNNYGLQLIGWDECFDFIFASEYSRRLLWIFVILLIVNMIYDVRLITFDNKQMSFGKLDLSSNKIEITWELSGVLAVLGTIVASQLVSRFFFPITLLRYLYVSYIVAWFLFGVFVSKLRYSIVVAVVILYMIIPSGYIRYQDLYEQEKNSGYQTEETLNATSMISKDDVIITNMVHFNWTVGRVYYPDVENELFGNPTFGGTETIPDIDFNKDNYLFLKEAITDELDTQLLRKGAKAELIVENGKMGMNDVVWVYEIKRQLGD